MSTKICYQCEEPVAYLFADSRCHKCTRLTPDEVVGNPEPCGYCGSSRDPEDICKECWETMAAGEYPPVYFVDEDEAQQLHLDSVGFYFGNEYEQPIGPYATRSAAAAAYHSYCDMLDHLDGC